MEYTRQDVSKYILQALRDLGGQAHSKKLVQRMIDREDGVSSEEVYFEKVSKKSGKSYHPFRFDYNFGLKNLIVTGYIVPYERLSDVVEITLTEKGRVQDLSDFPTKYEQVQIKKYWDEKKSIKANKQKIGVVESLDGATGDDEEEVETSWTDDLLSAIKNFSNAKFESFSRLLVNKMGVKLDKTKGMILSGDGGIDGFGYFESDEFRTSRVAIQAKRYTTAGVSSPDIDKFKGAMDKFNAEYGIFITTSYFTESAIEASRQGSRLITLIDGERITELVEQKQIHVKPVTTFVLDDYYFESD